MRAQILLAALFLTSSVAIAADTYVDGYYKKDGTYVAPHHQTKQDNKLYNNYSAEGQTNPYTGAQGTKKHEYSTPPAYPKSEPLYTAPTYQSPYSYDQPKRKNPYGY